MMTKEEKLTRIVGKIANEITWLKGRVVDVPIYSKGYIELKLQNDMFVIVELKNEFEANVRIPSLGGFNAMINSNDVCRLLSKLSH